MKGGLTRQQWLIWCCWVGGMTQKQTGITLQVSISTVKAHRDAIRRKLGRDAVYTERTPTHG